MPSVANQPQIDRTQARHVFRETYGLEPMRVDSLPGERDRNFLVSLDDGRRFVFKVCNPSEPREFLEVQADALESLHNLGFVPQGLLDKDGRRLATLSSDESEYVIRAVAYLPGTPLAQVRRPSRHLLADLGRKLAQLDRALEGVQHPILQRDFDWNLLHGVRVVGEQAERIPHQETRALVTQLGDRIAQSLQQTGAELRQATIHNDANDYNVIVSNGRDEYGERSVSGIIDFGDMAWSYLVGELAVAIAYVACRRHDPINAACEIIEAYHEVHPLEEVEIACLLDLILLRLCVSVCMSARQQSERPDDEYLTISQEPIRRTLPLLNGYAPAFVEAKFRDACGMAPSRGSTQIAAWISAECDRFQPVMGARLDENNTDVINLSVESPNAEVFADDDVEKRTSARRTQIHSPNRFAIGRYDEPRLIYSGALFDASSSGGPIDERRTIHLGIDIFAPAGSSVFAPLAGEVVASEYRDFDQDYGGVIILRHNTDVTDPFYTLYGHLSRASADARQLGDIVPTGHPVGQLGTPDENGGWAPHLHLQVITDLLGLDDDFPGVALAGERNVWTAFSPNPSELAGIDSGLQPHCRAPKFRDAIQDRRHNVGPSVRVAYRRPLHLVRGQMQYLFDADGRRYLDAYNNVPHVGHCHPRVVAAAYQQMKTLNTNTRYLHHLLNEYAKRLSDTLPDSLEVCYFLNSASEANELAIRLARQATGRLGIVVQESAYHGHTSTLIDISPYKHDGPGGKGTPEWVHKVPVPDPFRGQYRGRDAGCAYASDVAQIIQEASKGAYAPAAFIAETLPSVGGQIVPPPEYLGLVHQAIRECGGLAIADEVQTGFGRLGASFWAFEKFGVIPDIVVMGKPMGNGHPIAAVVTTRAVADAFDNGMEFFSTFGGNTVSCAVGLAVLDVLKEERLQAQALETGRLLESGFGRLAAEFPLIGDVRGSGLFWGLELIRDPETLEPAAAEATMIVNRLRDQGVLIGTDGPLHNVLKIRPPMPFNQSNAEQLIAQLRDVLYNEFELPD